MTNKYAETLKDITNKIDLIDIASSPERSGALYHELDKLADEADANKVIAIKDSIQQSLKTLGADVDTADDSFMYEGSKYYISISKAED